MSMSRFVYVSTCVYAFLCIVCIWRQRQVVAVAHSIAQVKHSIAQVKHSRALKLLWRIAELK